MKFEEWYEKEYGDLYRDTALAEAFKEVALKAWMAATRNYEDFIAGCLV